MKALVDGSRKPASRCRANSTQMRQSRTTGLCLSHFAGKHVKTAKVFPSRSKEKSLDSKISARFFFLFFLLRFKRRAGGLRTGGEDHGDCSQEGRGRGTPKILNPKPQTTHLLPQTTNPKPQTTNPKFKPRTPHPKPQTPDPTPQTPNPKPHTPHPKP